MSENRKIGVIGRRGDVLTFQAAGFATYQAESMQEAAGMLRKAAEECAIIFLTPEYAAGLPEDIARYDTMLTPAVIALPEKGGGVGMAMLRQAAERAIGADILFRDEP
ncbi:MAG: V-type ATP synthase subunit F [Ruminococcaceae bacterium]|nr:V-type ATP synthase subunit F [Oscillospiraceae bacterium]